MTLNKQLWLTIITVVLLNAAISFWLLFTSTRQTFEEQLYLKNIDDANSLAITLTQADKTDATVELLVAAKFNAGHFSRIELADTQQETLIKLVYEDEKLKVPGWFAAVAGFSIPAGTAQVADGWSQYATVYVESQTAYALEMLWQRFKKYVASILLIALGVGFVGSIALRLILKPLEQIVFQAHSFSQRRFVTIGRPSTPDFAKVVDAMNSLALRFKTIVTENNTRLEDSRFRSQHDMVTGLPNINAFFTLLESQLRYRDKDGQNVLIVHSLASDLYDIQTILGADFNQAISDYAQRITHFYARHPTYYTDCRTARINETDIAVLLTDALPLQALQEAFAKDSEFAHGLPVCDDQHASICTAGVYIKGDESSYELMDRVDAMLAEAQQQADLLPFEIEPLPADKLVADAAHWQAMLQQVPSRLVAHSAALKDVKGQIVHEQAFFTLRLDDTERNLSYVVRTAREFNTVPELDIMCLTSIIEQLKANPDKHIAALLYPSSIITPHTLRRLYQLLDDNLEIASRLALELRESSAAQYETQFKSFCKEIKLRGVGIGLKRVGESFSQVADIHEYGLDYVKIDSAYVYDLKNNQTNQTYLRGLSDLAHSLGMKVYADGVCSTQDENILFEIGFDGVVVSN